MGGWGGWGTWGPPGDVITGHCSAHWHGFKFESCHSPGFSQHTDLLRIFAVLCEYESIIWPKLEIFTITVVGWVWFELTLTTLDMEHDKN